MTATEKKKATARAEGIAELKRLGLRRGSIVYVIQKHRAASGMLRVLDLYLLGRRPTYAEKGPKFKIEPLRITWSAAQVLGWKYDRKREGIRVAECGMDVHFHTVYELSAVLFNSRKGKHDAGYVLTHRTL